MSACYAKFLPNNWLNTLFYSEALSKDIVTLDQISIFWLWFGLLLISYDVQGSIISSFNKNDTIG
jgi:hypothetical protein